MSPKNPNAPAGAPPSNSAPKASTLTAPPMAFITPIPTPTVIAFVAAQLATRDNRIAPLSDDQASIAVENALKVERILLARLKALL